MSKFLVLRRLTGSDLGWFADARRQGKARGRQRGINFNVEVMEQIFGDFLSAGEVALRSVRYSDKQSQMRRIRLQQKNWRLVGDKVSGGGLESVSVGDFFWCVIDLDGKDQPTLIWDVLTRRQQPDLHAAITSEFISRLAGSMRTWNLGEPIATRLLHLLKLSPEKLRISGTGSKGVALKRDLQTGSHTPIRSGSAPLRPRARLVQAIGEDLISNEIVALVELIKNAYDADARSVDIEFEPPLRPGEGVISVRDDGHGMSLEVLQAAWMEPATISKTRKRLSPGGRRMTGEKGLGRFAAARLARRMRLESVAKGSRKRIVAEFDWEEFRREDKFLDQVHCKWSEFSATARTPSGTNLTLNQLQDEWNFEAFRRLRAELSRLIVQRSAEDPFTINLTLPVEFEDLAGPITPPPVLLRPHYALQGEMSKSGTLTANLHVGDTKRRIKERVVLKGGRAPECGPFSFDFKVWDRDRDELGRLAITLGSTVRELRRDLNEAAGVSVYRDLFRVLPYGSAANDWLRLDLRRVQNPTMRLSNNQIVGAVYITADENPELRDQTNREGIVDSQAFGDLRFCVGEVLTHIERARYEQRRKVTQLSSQGSLFEELSLTPLREAFAEKYPKDQEFLEYLEEKDRRVQESVEQIQEVIVRYRRLATLGQLVDVVLHDGRTPIASISNQCDLGQRDLSRTGELAELRAKLTNRLDTIATQTVALSGLFKKISPFGGRKRGHPQDYRLESLIADSFALFHDRVDDLGVSVSLPKSSTMVRVDAAEIQQVVVNLLDNALYWLAKVDRKQRKIAVRVNKRKSEIEILFSDSGPGVPEELRDVIFDPYFSARPEGVGLGLTIAGEIISEYDGSLDLIEPGLLDGASFRATLKAVSDNS